MIFFTFIWAKKERTLIAIICFVVLLHLFFGLCTLSQKTTSLSKDKIIVRTSTAIKQKTYQPVDQKHLAKKKTSSFSKAKTTDTKKRALKQLAESFAKLEKMHQELPKTLPLSTPSLIVPSEEEGKEEEKDYIEKLTIFLQEHLELPEKGSVQLTLTIIPSGLIKKLKILASESKKNQHYIEKHLPFLKCPSFIEDKAQVSENTFTINFCNETH